MKAINAYVGLFVVTASVAMAQLGGAVGGAVNGAAGANLPSAPAPRPEPPRLPPPPAPPTVPNAGAAGSGSLNGNGSLRADRPLRDGVGVNTDVNTRANAQGEARGLDVAALASTGASASLDTAATMADIRGAAMASRDAVLRAVDTRIDASVRATGELKRSSRRLDTSARADFDAAIKDADAKEKIVRDSAKAASKARADAWESAQAKLATDYEAYASAVARAEAAGRIATSAPVETRN